MREDEEEDLLSAEDTSQQWQLRKMAWEAALKGVAKSELRRFLEHNKSFNCTDVNMGVPALFCGVVNRRSTPR